MFYRTILILFVFSSISTFGQSYYSVHGWDVEAQVDTAHGYFGIGQYSTGRCLTEDYLDLSSPSSNMVFRIDGETYAWRSIVPTADHELNDYRAPGYPILLAASNIIQNRWNFSLPAGELIEIDQFLTPDSYVSLLPDSVVDSLGIVKVTYRFSNLGILPHSIGLEHKWDININGVDHPIFTSPTMTDTNCAYSPEIPGSFGLAEIDPFDPVIDQLSVIGIIGIDDATRPDFFALGDESILLPSCFSVGSSFAGGSYPNTGALLRWNDRMIPAGFSFDIITYYGFGRLIFFPGELYLAMFGITDWPIDSCKLADNPKEFTAIVSNNSYGLITFDTVWLCIEFDSSLAEMVVDPTDIYADSLCYTFLDLAVGSTEMKTWLFDAIEDTFGMFQIIWTCSTSTAGVDAECCTTYSTIPEIEIFYISLFPGWNLVSTPDSWTVPAWTPTVYFWDNPTSSYIDTSELAPGYGYWALNASHDSLGVCCRNLDSYTRTILTGWNLIGAVDHAISRGAISTTPPGLMLDLFGWSPSTMMYFPTDSLYPGHGYWLLSSGDGTITVGP